MFRFKNEVLSGWGRDVQKLTYKVYLLNFMKKNFISEYGGTSGIEPAANARDTRHVQSWAGKVPWRREWQPTPVFLPGEFPGLRRLAGDSPWGCKLSDRIEQLTSFHYRVNIGSPFSNYHSWIWCVKCIFVSWIIIQYCKLFIINMFINCLSKKWSHIIINFK